VPPNVLCPPLHHTHSADYLLPPPLPTHTHHIILNTHLPPPPLHHLQALLNAWEEKVARQLEFISELQSPTQRNSMMAVSAARDSTAAAAAGLRASHSRIPSFSAALSAQSVEALRASLTGEMVGGQQAVGPVSLSRSSTLNAQPPPAAAAAASAHLLRNSGFGSSFSSASFAGGLLGGGGDGGGVSASAPSSPQLWDKAGGGGGQGGSTPVVVPHRSAFTPGPGLTGMGDASPGGINTPR
jgi:hypothetical protein